MPCYHACPIEQVMRRPSLVVIIEGYADIGLQRFFGTHRLDRHCRFGFADACISLIENGAVQAFLAAEMIVDHALAGVGALGDLVDPRAAQAFVGELLARDVEDVGLGISGTSAARLLRCGRDGQRLSVPGRLAKDLVLSVSAINGASIVRRSRAINLQHFLGPAVCHTVANPGTLCFQRVLVRDAVPRYPVSRRNSHNNGNLPGISAFTHTIATPNTSKPAGQSAKFPCSLTGNFAAGYGNSR